MPFALILIGAVIVVVAFNGTQAGLASELENDIPGFFKWAAAIAAILGLGFVPGLRTPSRWLLALVALVILLTNYQRIIAGFQNFAQTGAQTAQAAGRSEQQAAAAQQAAQAQSAQAAVATQTAPSFGSNMLSSIISNPLSAFSLAGFGGLL